MPNPNPIPIPPDKRYKKPALGKVDKTKDRSPKYEIRPPANLYAWCRKVGAEYVRKVLTRAMEKHG